MIQYILTGAVSILSAVMTILLTIILNRLTKLEDKLDGKRDAKACDQIRGDCVKFRDNKEVGIADEAKELWDIFNRHSHTGLAPDSKVTR